MAILKNIIAIWLIMNMAFLPIAAQQAEETQEKTLFFSSQETTVFNGWAKLTKINLAPLNIIETPEKEPVKSAPFTPNNFIPLWYLMIASIGLFFIIKKDHRPILYLLGFSLIFALGAKSAMGVYCANPSYPSVCTNDAESVDNCCGSTLYFGDPGYPASPEDCKTNWVSDTNNLTQCATGCCCPATENQYDTNISCILRGIEANKAYTLLPTGSSNVDCNAICTASSNSCEDNMKFMCCENGQGTEYAGYTCPAGEKCFSSCAASTVDCSAFKNNQSECIKPENKCYWCNETSGNCTDSCGKCEIKIFDKKDDRICDVTFSDEEQCASYNSLVQCGANAKCKWCSDTTECITKLQQNCPTLSQHCSSFTINALCSSDSSCSWCEHDTSCIPNKTDDATYCCGDGRVEGSEQCDDGNLIDIDECTRDCQNATCTSNGFLCCDADKGIGAHYSELDSSCNGEQCWSSCDYCLGITCGENSVCAGGICKCLNTFFDINCSQPGDIDDGDKSGCISPDPCLGVQQKCSDLVNHSCCDAGQSCKSGSIVYGATGCGSTKNCFENCNPTGECNSYTESDCSNGEDDDINGNTDCQDISCGGKSCTTCNPSFSISTNNNATLDQCCSTGIINDCDKNDYNETCGYCISCSVSGFAPQIILADVKHYRGQRQIDIVWQNPNCDKSVNYTVLRCDNSLSSCTDSEFIPLSLTPTTNLYYNDTSIEPETSYCYKIVANYIIPISTKICSIYSGEDECLNGQSEICLNSTLNKTATMSQWKIGATCNENNMYVQNSINCTKNGEKSFCRGPYPDGHVKCVDYGPCDGCNEPLGIYADLLTSTIKIGTTTPLCKSVDFCYFDTTKTTINKFYECEGVDSCYDYHSEYACNNSPCIVDKKCEWNYLYKEIGIGVCKPKETIQQNCSSCGDEWNNIFGVCIKDLCELTGDTCYYDENNDCVDAYESGCEVYTDGQDCTGGINATFNVSWKDNKKVNGTNAQLNKSLDKFNFGVCTWDGELCYKDADNSSEGDEFAGDMYSPETNFDFRSVKTNPNTGRLLFYDLVLNYTIFDINKSGDQCTSIDGFCSGISSLNYIISNKSFEYPSQTQGCDGGAKCAGKLQETNLNSGNYTLFYFSEDRSSNLEIVKRLDFQIDKDAPVVSLTFNPIPDYINFNESTMIISVGTDEFVFCSDMLSHPASGKNREIKQTKLNSANNYGKKFDLRYEKLYDGYYDFELNCTDLVGNTNKTNIKVRIDADPSVSDPYPNKTVNYTAVNLTLYTMNYANCSYRLNNAYPDLNSTWFNMTNKKNTSETNYTHWEIFNITEQYPNMTGKNGGLSTEHNTTYLFEFKCVFATGRTGFEETEFTIDQIIPNATAENYESKLFDFSSWYGIDNKADIYIKCADAPEKGFGCRNEIEYCISTRECTPNNISIMSKNRANIIMPQTPAYLCYRSKELNTTDKYSLSEMGNKYSVTYCNITKIDSVRPELIVENLTKNKYFITNLESYELKGQVLDWSFFKRSFTINTDGQNKSFIENIEFSNFTFKGTINLTSGKGLIIFRYDNATGNYYSAVIDKTLPVDSRKIFIQKTVQYSGGSSINDLNVKDNVRIDGDEFNFTITAFGNNLNFTLDSIGSVSAIDSSFISRGKVGLQVVGTDAKATLSNIKIREQSEEINNLIEVNASRLDTYRFGSDNFTKIINLQKGKNNISIKASDKAGNVHEQQDGKVNWEDFLIFLDQFPPKEIKKPVFSSQDYGNDISVNITVFENPSEANARNNVSYVNFEIVGTNIRGLMDCIGQDKSNCTWNFTIPKAQLPPGNYDIFVKACDVFNNCNQTLFNKPGIGGGGGITITDAPPQLKLFEPGVAVINGKKITNITILKIHGNYTELRPKNLTIFVSNGSSNASFSVDGLAPSSSARPFEKDIMLLPGMNTIYAEMYDDTNPPAKASITQNIYLDTIPPLIQTPSPLGPFDYGASFSIRAGFDDPSYTGNVTQASILIEGTSFTNSTTGSGLKEISLNASVSPVANRPGVFTLSAGNHTLIVIAKDMFGLTNTSRFNLTVIDKTAPNITLKIWDPDKSEYVNSITLGETQNKIYKVEISASEPLGGISVFTFKFPACQNSAGAIPKFNVVMTNEYNYTADLFIPLGYPCYTNRSENASFVINGTDANGVNFTENSAEPKQFTIDTKGPPAPEFFSDQGFVKSNPFYTKNRTITVYGRTRDATPPYVGNVSVIVEMSLDAHAGTKYIQRSAPDDNCTEGANIESDSQKGLSEILLEGNALQFSVGKFLAPGPLSAINTPPTKYNHTIDYSFYQITSYNYADGSTKIGVSPALYSAVFATDTAILCLKGKPTGYFSQALTLSEGTNYLKAYSQDALGNRGTSTNPLYRIVYDNIAPNFTGESPQNDYYGADEYETISVIINDAGGINCSSISLQITKYNVSDQLIPVLNCTKCALVQPCVQGSDKMPPTSFTAFHKGFNSDSTPGIDEGFYNATIYAQDMSGNNKTYAWSFSIDGNSTHAPQMEVTGGFEFNEAWGKTWYVNSTRPDIILRYIFDNELFINITNIEKYPLESPAHKPIASRMDYNTFRVNFNADLKEDFGVIPTTLAKSFLHMLNVSSRKQYSESEWSNEGRHFRYFIVDTTPPLLTINPISATRNMTPTIFGNFTERNINYIKLWGTDLFGEFNATIKDTSFNATIQFSTSDNGNKTYFAMAYDKAGNPSAQITLITALDTEPPTISSNCQSNGAWTNQNLTISFNGADALTGMHSIKYCEGLGCNVSTGSTYTMSISYSGDQTLHKNITLKYMAYDLAGNPSEEKRCHILIDQKIPITQITSNVVNNTPTNGDAIITLSPDCSLSGCESTKYCLGEGCDILSGTPYTIPILLQNEGRHVLRFSSKDNAGNIEPPNTFITTIDRTKPFITLNGISNDNIKFVGGKWYTNKNIITISATSSENMTITINVEGATPGSITEKINGIFTGIFSKNFTLINSKTGANQADTYIHNITLSGYDLAKNYADNITAQVIFDTSGPNITMVVPKNSCDSTGCNYFTNTVNPIIELITDKDSMCEINPAGISFVSMAKRENVHTYSGYGLLNEGSYHFEIKCRDTLLGNTNNISSNFTVDVQKPTIYLNLTNGELVNAEYNGWTISHRLNGLIQTDISAYSTEKIRCNYTCIDCTPELDDFDYNPPFGNSTEYKIQQLETVIYPVGFGRQYTYNVECQDNAGNSEKKQIIVLNMVQSSIAIISSYPYSTKMTYINSTSFKMWVQTSQYSKCKWIDSSEHPMTGLIYNHTADVNFNSGANGTNAAYTINVRCDSLDSPTKDEKQLSFTIDTASPGTPVIISSHTFNVPSNNKNPSFTFSSTDSSGILGYSYVLDSSPLTIPDGSLEEGSSTIYSTLEDGTYYFHVKAQDNAGIFGQPAHYKIIIDSTSPSAPVISIAQHYTSDGRISLAGTTNPADGNITVKIYILAAYTTGIEGALAPIVLTSAGAFSTNYTLPASNEHYVIKAQALDSYGNSPSDFSNIIDVFFIRNGPILSSILPSNNSKNCRADKIQATVEPYHGVRISSATMELRNSQGVVISGTQNVVALNNNSIVTFTPQATLADSVYSAKITAQDILGNNVSYTASFEISRNSPCISVVFSDPNCIASDLCYTKRPFVDLTINAQGFNATLKVVSATGTRIEQLGIVNSIPKQLTMDEDKNTIILSATNSFSTSLETIVAIKDTYEPELSPMLLQHSINASSVVHEESIDAFSYYLDKYMSELDIQKNNELQERFFVDNLNYPRRDFYLRANMTLLEGLNTILFKAIDKAGNFKQASLNITLDTTAPQLSIIKVKALEGQAYYSNLINAYKVNKNLVTISGSYSDGNFANITLKGTSNIASINNGLYSINVTLNSVLNAEAENNITLVASDLSGLKTEAKVKIIVDKAAPVPNITNLIFGGDGYYTQEEKGRIEIKTNEYAKCNLRYVPKSFNGFFEQNFTSADGFSHYILPLNNFNYEVDKNLKTGVTITCEDSFGNNRPQTEITIIVDKTQPEILEFNATNSLLESVEQNKMKFLIISNPFTELVASRVTEPVRCRYGTTSDFDHMIDFKDFNIFKMYSVSEIITLQDQSTYNYIMMCEDRAGRKTYPKALEVVVNLSPDVRIISKGPEGFVFGGSGLIIWVETFRNSTCEVDQVFEGSNSLTNWLNDLFNGPFEMNPGSGMYFNHTLILPDIPENKTYIFEISCNDDTGQFKPSNTKIEFSVVQPLNISIVSPKNGASSFAPFDIKIATTRNAECRYDTSGVPLSFENQLPFSETGSMLHVIFDFNMNSRLNVKCRDSFNFTVSKSFSISIDYTRPIINEAYANPEKILYEVDDNLPGTTNLQTILVVKTNEPTICKFSQNKTSYTEMEYWFDGVNESSLQSDKFNTTNQVVILNLPDGTVFNYRVACKNLAELISDTKDIRFQTNLNEKLDVLFNEPRQDSVSNKTFININATTNKISTCFYGVSEDNITTQIGNSPANNHYKTNAMTNLSQGWHIVFLKCYFGAESTISSSSFIVDYTKPTVPVISHINVTGHTDRLTAFFVSYDNESGIMSYKYAVGSYVGAPDVVNWTETEEDSATATGLNLSDGKRYYWSAISKNKAGLESDIGKNLDGIMVDITVPINLTSNCSDKRLNGKETDVDCGGPQCAKCALNKSCSFNDDCLSDNCNNKTCRRSLCENNITDEGETAVDCGGSKCPACQSGGSCTRNDDCITKVCSNGECKSASCLDGLKNGDETDIDCGGLKCNSCEDGMSCTENEDCGSNYCDVAVDTCEAAECDDGVFNGDETDVDCGGACGSCETGSKCKLDADCESGNCMELFCAGGKENKDSDVDGLPDDWEIKYGLNLSDPDDAKKDNDGDLLNNLDEYNKETNPLEKDTDEDGYDDNIELDEGFDPVDPDSHPSGILSTIFLIAAIIAVLGIVCYLGYTEFYVKKKKNFEPSFGMDFGQPMDIRPEMPSIDMPARVGGKTPAGDKQTFMKKAPEKMSPEIIKEKEKQRMLESQKIGEAFSSKKDDKKASVIGKKIDAKVNEIVNPRDDKTADIKEDKIIGDDGWVDISNLKPKKEKKAGGDLLDRLSGFVKSRDVFDELQKATSGKESKDDVFKKFEASKKKAEDKKPVVNVPEKDDVFKKLEREVNANKDSSDSFSKLGNIKKKAKK